MTLTFAVGTFLSIVLIASIPTRAQNSSGFASKDTNVDGLKLHYTMGGQPLDPGRAAEGNDRRASEVFVERVLQA